MHHFLSYRVAHIFPAKLIIIVNWKNLFNRADFSKILFHCLFFFKQKKFGNFDGTLFYLFEIAKFTKKTFSKILSQGFTKVTQDLFYRDTYVGSRQKALTVTLCVRSLPTFAREIFSRCTYTICEQMFLTFSRPMQKHKNCHQTT